MPSALAPSLPGTVEWPNPRTIREFVASDGAVITGVTQHGDDFVIAVEKDPGSE